MYVERDKLKIINQSVDTLKVGFECMNEKDYEKFTAKLVVIEGLKDDAQKLPGYGSDRYVTDKLGLDMGLWRVHARGVRRYAFIVDNSSISMQIGRSKLGSNTPHIMMEFRSEFLQKEGMLRCFYIGHKIAKKLLGEDVKHLVSEIHLNTDILGLEMRIEDRYRFYSRCFQVDYLVDIPIREYSRLELCTGFQIGKGDFLWRIYDKEFKVRNTYKERHILSKWASQGYEDYDPVWRFEVQLRRDHIKKFLPRNYGGSEIEMVHSKLADLWFYSLEKFSFIDWDDETVLKIMKKDWSKQTHKNNATQAKKDPEKMWFYDFISVWDDRREIEPELYSQYRYVYSQDAVKRALVSFLSTYAKYSSGDFSDLPKMIEKINDEFLSKEGLGLLDLALEKRIVNFCDYAEALIADEGIPDADFHWLDMEKSFKEFLKVLEMASVSRDGVVNRYQKVMNFAEKEFGVKREFVLN